MHIVSSSEECLHVCDLTPLYKYARQEKGTKMPVILLQLEQAKIKEVDDFTQSQKDWVEMEISDLLVQCPIHHHGFPVLLSH